MGFVSAHMRSIKGQSVGVGADVGILSEDRPEEKIQEPLTAQKARALFSAPHYTVKLYTDR